MSNTKFFLAIEERRLRQFRHLKMMRNERIPKIILEWNAEIQGERGWME